MPVSVTNIYPKSTTYTHEVALTLTGGAKYGLRLKDGANSIQDSAPQTNQPVDQVMQFSYHLGRGVESFTNKNQHFAFYDSKDAWTTTLGKFHPAPLWQWSRGLRSMDVAWYGNVSWKKINSNADPYLSVSYVSSGFTGTHIQFPLRRRGKPGTLTVTIRADDGGNPHASTIHQTVTITSDSVSDTPMVVYDGEPSSYAFTASTTYHLVFYSADTDDENCWEIGCNASAAGKRSANGTTWTSTTYSPYYRITDADVDRRLYPFMYDGAMYVVDSLASGGNSTLYINGGRGKATAGSSTSLTDSALNMTTDRYVGAYIQIIRGTGAGQSRQIAANSATAFTVSSAWSVTPSTDSEYVVYKTPWFHTVGSTGINGFTSAAAGSSGLGYVYSTPAVGNNIVYFPQGDSVAIRRMRWNASTKVHDFASENATGKQGTAYFLESGFHDKDGAVIYRANNATATGSGGAQTVSRAKVTTWGTNLSFKLPNEGSTVGVYIGDTSSIITGMKFNKSDRALLVHKENSLWRVANEESFGLEYGAEDMPSIYNGQAMAQSGAYTYFSFWTTLMQMAGGTIRDTKLWLSNLPAERVGNVRGIESAFGWLFSALDANTGTGSVALYVDETQAWHELFRGFEAGRRVRNVFWQPNDDTNPFVWIDIGGELVYMMFPRSPRPLQDNSILYAPECVLETSTVDLNVNPKFFGTLKAVTKNLSASGREIYVDYQMDNYVGSTTWFHAGRIVESPSDEVQIGVGRIRKIRLRFRLNTNTATIPPILEHWALEFFEREPSARFIRLDVDVAPNRTTINGGGQDHKPTELYNALMEMSKTSEVITIESIDPSLHLRSATMYAPPFAKKDSFERGGEWSGTIQVYLKEIL